MAYGRQMTCENHDNCVVVYTTSECPICELEQELQDASDEAKERDEKRDE